ncbi:MAG: ThuA domain-containing protein [Balneolales bacterium]
MKAFRRDHTMKILGGILFAALLPFLSSCSDGASRSGEAARVLILGGGEHHDFDTWFNLADSTTLAATGTRVRYTDDPGTVLPGLESTDVLYMNNNQPLEDPSLRQGIFNFTGSGNGLLLVHAATWYSWPDWPEFNRDLVGGGANGHGPLGEFEVKVVDHDHPVMQSVPDTFRITDELYRFEKDEDGPDIHVLAVGIEPGTGNEYPVAWTLGHGDGRVVCITLGHDGDSHEHEAYTAMLKNSIGYLKN